VHFDAFDYVVLEIDWQICGLGSFLIVESKI